MAGKKTGKRLLTWVLVLVMALSLLPLNALAAGGSETDSGSGMIFTKKLVSDVPDKDGNYTIQMTAQATGKEVETTKPVPMDIVLVLDQSGSMADDFNGNYTSNNEARRQYAMKAAVNSFIGEVAKKYGTNADHRMAIVTFYSDAETLARWTAVDKDGGASELTGKISALSNTPSGATNVGAGMELAQTLMDNDAYTGDNTDRQKTVIVFTDGVPTTESDFDTDVANNAISAAKSMKGSGVTIYTVGIFNGAKPTELYGKDKIGTLGSNEGECSGKKGDYWQYREGLFSGGDIQQADIAAGNRFLNYLSSNYEANKIGVSRYEVNHVVAYYIRFTITDDPAKGSNQGYYKTASNASSLNSIFKTISDTVPEPVNSKLDDKTVITDTLSDYFTFALTEDGKMDVKVYAKRLDGSTYDITDGITVDGKTVTVTNYDFSAHYKGIGNAEETLFIEIKVKPDTSYTNWGTSGKYETNKGNATVTHPNIEEPIAEAASPEAHVDTYKVTYQPGEGSGDEYTDQYYLNGAKTKVLENRFAAQKGYEFDCWKDEDGNTYQAGGTITFDKSNVTLTAQWKLIEAADLSVEKTVTRINGSTPTTDANGNITTIAYPGDEIEWTITVANSGNATGNFTLNETLSGITVKDTAGNPVALSNNEWRGTVAANDSVSYTVTYTVKASDVTDNGLVNTVTMNGTSENSAPVPTAQKYTVTYEYTGTIPTDASAVPAAAQHEFGAEVTIENVPTLTGYTFHGWTLPEGLTANDGKFNMPAKNVTITGYWTKNTIPTYTFDLNDPDTIKVDKKFVSKYGLGSPMMRFTATATIEKQETYIIVNPGIDNNVTNNGSAVPTKPDYTKVGEATGTVTLKAGKTEAFDFGKNSTFQLEQGDYCITVKETNSGDRYVTYDTKPYTRYFKVSEDGVISAIESITITNEYTKRHTAATPSKPTLNTGDHYAYVMGYPDGTVRPNGSITRAEVSAILFRLLSDKTRDEYFTTESSFTDVKAGAWYNNSIATLEKAGVIVDTAKGGAFRPNEAITRAELAAMLAQFSDAKPVKGVKFSDVPAEHWAYEAIAIAAKMGWIEGYPNGTFRPDATITRAEMMTLVNRALERVPSDEDHLLSKRVMLTFPDCKSGDWFYIAVQEATNSHTYERAATEKNGDEQWTALRANRDWTLLEK